jgi:hypothetical protein
MAVHAFFATEPTQERGVASSCVVPNVHLDGEAGWQQAAGANPEARKWVAACWWRATGVLSQIRTWTAAGAGRRRTPRLDSLAVFVYGRTVPSRRCLWALALGLVVPLGCGPVEYLTRVSSRAASALAEAGREGAEQKAPYEYAKAAEYYHKAREDAAHSYYQTAIDWGRRSEDCSRKAIARAKQSQPAGRGAHPDHTTCGEP